MSTQSIDAPQEEGEEGGEGRGGDSDLRLLMKDGDWDVSSSWANSLCWKAMKCKC